MKKYLQTKHRQTPGSCKAGLRKIEAKLIPEIYRQIEGKSVEDAIETVEASLAEIPPTPFHVVAGRGFLQNVEALSEHLIEFHGSVIREFQPAAVYFEMNGFSINPDMWYLDSFAYRNYGGLNDPEWLCEWDSPEYPAFRLAGMEDIQSLFEKHYWSALTPLETRFARTVAEFLIALRFCELVGRAHQRAKERSSALNGLRVLANAHDYDCLYESS
jgi:hypothetical protein